MARNRLGEHENGTCSHASESLFKESLGGGSILLALLNSLFRRRSRPLLEILGRLGSLSGRSVDLSLSAQGEDGQRAGGARCAGGRTWIWWMISSVLCATAAVYGLAVSTALFMYYRPQIYQRAAHGTRLGDSPSRPGS